jgi:hypothetical protein
VAEEEHDEVRAQCKDYCTCPPPRVAYVAPLRRLDDDKARARCYCAAWWCQVKTLARFLSSDLLS